MTKTLLIAFLAVACTSVPQVQTGVSWELAKERKAQLSDVHYALEFSIPSDKSQPVCGQADISFSWKQTPSKFLVLDFLADPGQVKGVKVDGHMVDYSFVNEHIIVNTKNLQETTPCLSIEFESSNASLNRNPDYLYTLSVPDRARSIFPCFDQPDMKAVYSLKLHIPQDWEAVSNARVATQSITNEEKHLSFEPTLPISSYLFAFSVGKWQKISQTRAGRTITMYHRETDASKLAQCSIIFDQVFASISWMEDYTGIPMPFPKYDFVVVPGFQFGGMEHPGVILYNNKTIFPSENATFEEEEKRRQLISHETAHLWFGDAVTMAWFDDVWTKEIFANYFASLISPSLPLPQNCEQGQTVTTDDKLLTDLRNSYVLAYSEDRTLGSSPIKKNLTNLKYAGLVYDNIVYHKAPIVMSYLVKMLGEEAFQLGVREYLQKYLYTNATWEDLIGILDARTALDLTTWSNAWVSENSMPSISAYWEGDSLVVRQSDPLGRGILWSQELNLTICDGVARVKTISGINLDKPQISIPCTGLNLKQRVVLLNTPAGAYGHFAYDDFSREYLVSHFAEFGFSPTERMSLLMQLFEEMHHGNLPAQSLANLLIDNLHREKEQLIISLSLLYLKEMALQSHKVDICKIERELWALSQPTSAKECNLLAFRTLLAIFRQEDIVQSIYQIWQNPTKAPHLKLNDRDLMTMAYELCVRLPQNSAYIIATQAARLSNPDLIREFNFVSRSVAPSQAARDSLFASFSIAENRLIEPWTTTAIKYLNHTLYQEQAVKYITPALNLLEEIQRTGDIFFPSDFMYASFYSHNSGSARKALSEFLDNHPNYQSLLRSKILQSADHLLQGEIREGE